jgi:neurofibromin 1
MSSSNVLLTLCEAVTSKKDDQSLRDLQDYLEARLLILKNIPVCLS